MLRPDPLPHGIVPMQYAFFGADGALDLGAFRLQVDACCLERHAARLPARP